MTIKKVVSIKNVGRLLDCKQKGPELSRYSLAFAENGRGKTTLGAVLRSLQTGEPDYILGRKTLGQPTGEPSAEIRTDAGSRIFANGAWNDTLAALAIFDAGFVAQNIHSGEYVGRDQRRSLLQVVIGETGVGLARRVDDLDALIRDKTGELTTSRRSIQRLLPREADVDVVLALELDPEIDQKLAAKTAELNAAQRANDIQARALFSPLTAPGLPAGFEGILRKTLDDISEDAETTVKEHLNRHEMHDTGEAWLAEGIGYIRGETCPFCGQGMAGRSLIEAYRRFFGQAYRTFRQEIEGLREHVEGSLGDVAIANVERRYTSNQAGIEFWRQFVELNIETIDIEEVLARPTRALCSAALGLVDRKLSSPLEGIDIAPLSDAVEAQRAGLLAIERYNRAITAANTLVQRKKDETQRANAQELEQELNALRIQKARHDEPLKTECGTYRQLLASKAQLDIEKTRAKDALDQHADATITRCEATINALLEQFGAGFRIANTRRTYIGGTPTTTYQIMINDQPVELGDADTPIHQPSFRTTLSAGDKSTLALAFFLAHLDHDPSKADRILVFDDPFNSQDRSRREVTAELLRRYGDECQQLLLMSHDPYFLKLVWDRLPRADRRAIQLSRIANSNTTIEEWDVEKETQEGYFRDHAALASYIAKGARDLVSIARKIRPVLEGYCRYRFPNTFADNDWLGDMIGKIRVEGDQHPLFPIVGELTAINDYSKKYHHDTNPGGADAEPINDGELQSYVRRTLKIVGGY